MSRILYLHHLEATGGGTLRYIEMLQRFSPPGVGFLLFDRGLEDIVNKRGGASTIIEDVNGPAYLRIPIVFIRTILKLRRIKPRVVHAHSSISGLVVRLLQPIFGYRCIYTPHCFAHTFPHSLIPRAFYRLVEKVLSLVHFEYIHVSYADAAEGKLITPGIPGRVIPSSCSIPTAGDLEWNENFSCRRLLVVGGNRRQKGYSILSGIQRALIKHNSRFSIFVLGAGRFGHGIDSAPWQEAVREFYRYSFCLLNVAHSEGCSLAVLDAMGCGIPVLSFDIPANRELLAEGRGVLIESRDEEKMADAIRQLSQSRDRYLDIRQRAFDFVQNRHHPQQFIDAYMNVYFQNGIPKGPLPKKGAPVQECPHSVRG